MTEQYDPTALSLATVRGLHPLAAAVMEQAGIDEPDELRTLTDAAMNGANGGVYGFIWHHDCRDFVMEHRVAIARELAEFMDDTDRNPFGPMGDAGFTTAELLLAFAGADLEESDGLAMAYSWLAWFALEQVGHAVIQHMGG